MKKILLLTMTCSLVSCAGHNMKSKPDVAFTVTEGISHPESALYSHKHQAIFVSNVASGNPLETQELGHITKLDSAGKVTNAKWVTGLKAPKGMNIIGDKLYVSDVDRLVVIDILNSKVLKKYPIKGSKFLNDVASDSHGNVYVTDMFDDAIYVLKKNKISVWLKDKKLRSPNGLVITADDKMYLVQWGDTVDQKTYLAKNIGKFALVDMKTKAITEWADVAGHLDGVAIDNEGHFVVSDWMSGDVYHVAHDGKIISQFNLKQGTADLSYSHELGLLLVPQMNESKLIGIKLK